MVRKKPEERRNEIIVTSLSLFEKNGYEKTRVEDILNVLGLSKGGFYHYFKSKDDIFVQIYREMMDKVVENWNDLYLDENLDPEEKIVSILKNQFLIKTDYLEIINYSNNPKTKNFIVKNFKDNILESTCEILGKILEQGTKEGIFNLEYPMETAKILINIYLSVVMIYAELNDKSKIKSYLLSMNQIFSRILGIEKGKLHLENWFPQ